jgi:hypothetical protein
VIGAMFYVSAAYSITVGGSFLELLDVLLGVLSGVI